MVPAAQVPYVRDVIFAWLDERRRKRILQAPFPEEWTQALRRNMVHFEYLDADERRRLCDLIQLRACWS